MTEKYDPYQNAITKRINGIIKQEFIGDIEVGSIDLMRLLIDESVEIYNTERPYFSCDLMTPKKMHEQRELRRKLIKKQNTLNLEYPA